ncbi:toll/interleukin-1 receptor domain-containing protein [Cryptosporangium phraense]|uniref:toll/interleukin-1 receptor domain-containing protein n=1 Tax=Cryptosporangium phraense TaxID=2593070 RepID=UPI00147850A8|nr:toll/interleukin-1 receptor domain-containing protein [Cryptosporangium phraense]
MTDYIASVFLSYSHADKGLAIALRDGLSKHGCRVWIDEGELKIGDSLIRRIGEALDQVDFVVALISEASVSSEWCQKEIALAMTGEVNKEGVTVLPLRIDETKMPESLKDKLYLSIDQSDITVAVDTLMHDIRRYINPAPALPPRRRANGPTLSVPIVDTAPQEPIKLTGIDSSGITEPSNDGTRGSALYSVPFTLSRTPDADWSRMLVGNWDRPPKWTTMHRPGIARVSGARIILDGTTMDEVERYHLTTLKLAVDETNKTYVAMKSHARAATERREQESRDHRSSVQNVLDRLDFD